MSAQAQPRLTPEQYLEAERAAEFRHEYYNGQIYAMSGGSYQHVQIIGNMTGELRAMPQEAPLLGWLQRSALACFARRSLHLS